MTLRRVLGLLVLFGGGFGCGVAALKFRQHLGVQAAGPPGWVNRQPVTREQLNRALLADRRNRFYALVEQELVQQAAAKKSLTVDDGELKPPKELLGLERENWLSLERSRLLVKKLILSQIPETEKKAFFETFRDQLKQYELRCFAFQPNQRKAVSDGIQVGIPWEKLKAQYGAKGALGDGLVQLNQPSVRARLGIDMAEAVSRASVGKASGPVITPGGLVCFELSRVTDSYADDLPQIEDIMVESKRLSFIFSLRSQASVREGNLFYP